MSRTRLVGRQVRIKGGFRPPRCLGPLVYSGVIAGHEPDLPGEWEIYVGAWDTTVRLDRSEFILIPTPAQRRKPTR